MTASQMTRADSGSLTWLTARPIAHRGLHDRERGIIENSRSAFTAAIELGYAIECDLQLTGDGEAMVFHDATLERLTGAAGRVIEMTAAELSSLSLKGSYDHPQTLAQLLAQINDRVPLIIELKSLWDGSVDLVRRTCDLVSAYHGRTAVMSFDPFMVATIRNEAPRLTRGGVADRFTPTAWPQLTEARRIELRIGDEMAQADPMFMSYALDTLETPGAKRYRAAGRPVICWTVRDEASAQYALEHCDQITFEGFLA